MKWNEFEYLPVALQDAKTRQVLMIQYMTEESVRRTLEEPSTCLWSRSRETHWLAGRRGGGYELLDLRGEAGSRATNTVVTPTPSSPLSVETVVTDSKRVVYTPCPAA